MCLNGGIFQAHCVNFEIKKKQIATPVISDYFCIYRYIFPVNSNSDFASAQAELGVFFPVVHRQRNAAQLGKV
jgi:hypothetical protein